MITREGVDWLLDQQGSDGDVRASFVPDTWEIHVQRVTWSREVHVELRAVKDGETLWKHDVEVPLHADDTLEFGGKITLYLERSESRVIV